MIKKFQNEKEITEVQNVDARCGRPTCLPSRPSGMAEAPPATRRPTCSTVLRRTHVILALHFNLARKIFASWPKQLVERARK